MLRLSVCVCARVRAKASPARLSNNPFVLVSLALGPTTLRCYFCPFARFCCHSSARSPAWPRSAKRVSVLVWVNFPCRSPVLIVVAVACILQFSPQLSLTTGLHKTLALTQTHTHTFSLSLVLSLSLLLFFRGMMLSRCRIFLQIFSYFLYYTVSRFLLEIVCVKIETASI